MLSVTYKPFKLSVITLNVVMLSVVMQSVVMQSGVAPNFNASDGSSIRQKCAKIWQST
jgi:hypothetical protein